MPTPTPPREIRLLLSDVDGTLVTRDKRLTAQSAAAARALQQAGIGLAITSSRPPRGLRMLVQPLALQGLLAGFNGGLIVEPDFLPVERHGLDPKAARQALELIQDQGLDPWLYTQDSWLVRDAEGAHVARDEHAVQFAPQVVRSFSDEDLAQAYKVVGVSDDYARVAETERLAQGLLGERASAVRSQHYYLDVTNPNANKGAVVDMLSRRLGIPAEQIATIGDMANDVSMFRKSGFSIAMGNATDEVKGEASVVTASNEDEGFAKAVRRWFLPPAM
jgi:Cof subfamily protein (haloacid dehalogenase superfamily)